MSEFTEDSAFGENEDPEIWDEFEWENFMIETDKPAKKYSHLLEKYRDHPNRKKIIAEEMGWEHLLDKAENEKQDPFGIDTFIEEGEEWKQATGYKSREFNSVENLPIYQVTYEFAIDSIDLIENRFENINDESIHKFASSVMIPSIKIAGGFAMGFELESLGGNIANCKRGLSAANRMLIALQEMRDRELLDQDTFQEFYEKGKKVRDGLGIYIVELREQFRKGIL